MQVPFLYIWLRAIFAETANINTIIKVGMFICDLLVYWFFSKRSAIIQDAFNITYIFFEENNYEEI